MLAILTAVPGVATFYSLAARVIGALLRCNLCMIAIAVGVAWIAGDIHGHRKEEAAWSAKWSAAEAKAERDRLARDVFAKAKTEADANDRLAGISARAEQLETKVQKYERDEELRRATGGNAAGACDPLTDQSDDNWLSDIKRKRKSSAGARGRLAERLRSNFAGSPDPGKR